MMRDALISSAVLCQLILFDATASNSGDLLIGEVSDGSRSIPVHLISLLDDKGREIAPDDEPLLPFTPRQTCSNECHDYETISSGWHFNASNPEIPAGRPCHPWIFVDVSTGTQIPLSYRSWPGAFKPEQVGLTPWKFVQCFGGHLPGGGVGELDNVDNPERILRGFVSGKLEVNCLCCHDGDPAHNQAEYAVQILRRNFRWAAASTSAFTSISGSAKSMPDTYDYMMPDVLNDPKRFPPAVVYRHDAFDHKNRVFFNIPKKVPAERCYFCHSTKPEEDAGAAVWAADEDVHMAAGLTCVDCHRNGVDHNMVRGYAGEVLTSQYPFASVFSCKGCHLGEKDPAKPTAGLFAAPKPEHAGIPAQHFDKLTCTACHSGLWPDQTAYRVKTSLAHGLGTHNVDKSEDALPCIFSPVFARQSNGRIAPHNLIWPAFWGVLNGESVTPIPIDVVKQTILEIRLEDESSHSADWPAQTEDFISETLLALTFHQSVAGDPVYICVGKLYRIDADGDLVATEHDAARPYLWAVAHDVRPAAQSLGVRGCDDCHALNAPFFFGAVPRSPSLSSERDLARSMIEFQGLDPTCVSMFALLFRMRPGFLVVTLIASGILAAVLLVYAFKALACILEALGERSS